jgi:ADP-heptose:LPS heptosyltransferase
VLTTPVIRCLKQQLEGSVVHFATKKQFLPLLKTNPYIDRIHCLENNLSGLIKELQQENFDYIIDLHHNLRTRIIKSRLRVLDFSFKKLNIQKWMKVNLKIDRLPRIHIVDRYLQTLTLFDVKNDGKGLDYFIPDYEEVDLRFIPEEFRKGYVALVIGARHYTKQLPLNKLVNLCNALDQPVILLGGQEDKQAGDIIAGQSSGLVLNCCGRFSINQSASLIKQARVVVSHDTGLMHIAAAFHKRIISIWGNTIPEFGMYPYLPGPASQIFQVEGLPCRPCSKIGFSTCPKKHFMCMNEMDEKQIASIVSRGYPD